MFKAIRLTGLVPIIAGLYFLLIVFAMHSRGFVYAAVGSLLIVTGVAVLFMGRQRDADYLQRI